MTVPHHLLWDNFRSTVLVRGEQRVHRVSDVPVIEVFGDGVLNRVGILVETDPDTPIPPEIAGLSFIEARLRTQNKRTLLEVATAEPQLYRQFYHFAVAVAERVVVDQRPATDAVMMELRCFTDLFAKSSILGIERQIGLLGELLFLERLLPGHGPAALDAWLGPSGEPHDFRLQDREFEVKTTVCTKRVHTVHGAEQLLPSKGCSLYLISILLGPPGSGDLGFSLARKAESLMSTLSADATRLAQYKAALESYGYRQADSGHYTSAFVLRRPLALAHIGSGFPAITRTVIQQALGSEAHRIEALEYDINIDGLESEDGTSGFSLVIPK